MDTNYGARPGLTVDETGPFVLIFDGLTVGSAETRAEADAVAARTEIATDGNVRVQIVPLALVAEAANLRAELDAERERHAATLAALEAFDNVGLICTAGHTTDGQPSNCTCDVHPELLRALANASAAIAQARGSRGAL